MKDELWFINHFKKGQAFVAYIQKNAIRSHIIQEYTRTDKPEILK